MPEFENASFSKIEVDEHDPNLTRITFTNANGDDVQIEIKSTDLPALHAISGTALDHAVKEGAKGISGKLSTPVHYYEVGYTPRGHLILGIVTVSDLRYSFFFEGKTAKILLGHIQEAVKQIQKIPSSEPTKH